MILDSPYISGSMSFGIANPSATMHISASTGAVLRVDGAGVTNTGSLFVSSSGNVGIGTVNPVSKLQVEGGALRIGDGAGSWSGFSFSGGLRQTNNNPVTLLGELRVDSTAGNPSYISGSGGLAVGKTTANTRLDVNGNTLISGSINATGPITGSSFTTTGTITAQTLVVQTISSSIEFVTGSTKFGSLATNTHQFTGSIAVSGSAAFSSGSDVTLSKVTTPVGIEYQVRNTNGASGNHVFKSFNTAILTLDGGTNNVGIGTSSPSTLLHLNANTTQITLQNVDGGTNAERIGMFMTSGDTFKIISLNDNNTTRVDNILVANILNGNVGIGTSSPTTKFFVLGAGSYNTTTSEILTSDATIFSSEMSNDAYNSILQLVSVRQSLTAGANSNGFLGFSTIDDSNGEGIRDAGRIAIVNESPASRNSATALGFWTNVGGTKITTPTERMRITSGGYLRLAGAGIQFNGDTADANSLDDYEEGTWTPAFAQAGTPSYTTQFGRYTKIGNMVYCTIALRATSVSGASTIQITGLPFTPADASDTGQRATYSPRLGGHINGVTETTAKFRITGGTTMEGVKGDGDTTFMTAAQFTSGGSVQLTGQFWYYV